MQPEENKNTKLKIAVDITSVFVVVFFIVITIIGGCYDTNMNSRGIDGVTGILEILMFVDAIPFALGLFWLCFRYNYIFTNIGKKYPFTRTQPFILFLTFGVPTILVILLKHKW